METKIAIAIDGPAAAGKSTVAKMVAQTLSYTYIDTGAMYRALTLSALDERLQLDNEARLAELLSKTTIELVQTDGGQRVYLNGNDVTLEIRSQEVTNKVSHVAKHPIIRKDMVRRQQILAQEQGVVMDGRDIGTHVLPHAEVKFFLIATVEERAKRRYEENISKGIPSNLKELKKDIEQRDEIDSKRDTAPLIKAEDAIEIDTTSLSIHEVVKMMLEIVHTFDNT
ncbi:MAG TPA: (d)CMP kinase [Virgibacillus sp.]|nr:(d)CMP kinase [Virgibacillus sp.]